MGWWRSSRPYGRCIYFHTYFQTTQPPSTHGNQQAQREMAFRASHHLFHTCSHFSPMICSGLIKKHLRLSTQQPQKARERDTDDTSSADTTKTADQWAEVDTLISQRKIWTPYACSNFITNTPDTRSYSNTNSLCAPTGKCYCSDVALSSSQQIAMTSQLHFIFQLWNFFYHFKY